MRFRGCRLLVSYSPFLLAGLLLAGGCKKDSDQTADTSPQTSSTTGSSATTQPSTGALKEIKSDDIKVGTGRAAKDGDQLSVVYTGTLKDGTVFDTNDKPDGQPFPFKLGAGSVIKGWDQGVVGMKAGGERKLSIPAALAYGDRATGKIPPNSDLYFDVKLKSVTSPEDLTTVQRSFPKQGSGPALKDGDQAVVNYKLLGDDGSVLDDKYETKTLTFDVATGKTSDGGSVIPVILDAVKGKLKVGGEMNLKIPSMYGPKGPQYAGNATYTIDLTLVKIISK